MKVTYIELEQPYIYLNREYTTIMVVKVSNGVAWTNVGAIKLESEHPLAEIIKEKVVNE